MGYFFYIYYTWAKRWDNGFPNNTARGILGLLIFLNMLNITFLIANSLGYHNELKSFGFIPFFILYVLIEIYIHINIKGKEVLIIEKFNSNKRQNRLKDNTIGLLSILITFLLMVYNAQTGLRL